jgi:hypothetical protein
MRHSDTKNRQIDPGISRRRAGIKKDEKAEEIKIRLYALEYQGKMINPT